MVFLCVPAVICGQFGTVSRNAPISGSGPGSPVSGDPASSSQQVSLLLHRPLDVFQRSHGYGISAEYAYSPGRFGMGTQPAHSLGWVVRGAVDYFIGRSRPTEGYAFRFSNYLYLQAMGGMIWNPVPFGNLTLTAGPGLGIYGGGGSIGLNGMAAANMFVDQQFSVGPFASFRKHKESDGLWTAGLRVGWSL